MSRLAIDAEREAWLWNECLRLAFCPSGTKEENAWLFRFVHGVMRFSQCGARVVRPKPKEKWRIEGHTCLLDVKFAWEKDPNGYGYKYSFEFYTMQSNHVVIWIQEHDPKYSSVRWPHLISNRRMEPAKDEEVAAVLDGMVFHPAVHQHVQSPIGEHEIRLGCGIDNPFLMLFNLWFQLCPDESTRDPERRRLVTLFRARLSNRNAHISPSELFGT